MNKPQITVEDVLAVLLILLALYLAYKQRN
jgi:hypothetical protein